jgi:hypothetical protein
VRPGGWHCETLREDDIETIRGLCDDAAIAVPPLVVRGLLEALGGEPWLTLPFAQAAAAAGWAYDEPGSSPAVVQLELRGETLNLTQGDESTSINRGGDEVETRPSAPAT